MIDKVPGQGYQPSEIHRNNEEVPGPSNANSETDVTIVQVANVALSQCSKQSSNNEQIQDVQVKELDQAEPVSSLDDTDENWKEQKSGHLYECVGRKENPLGGYIYEFHLRDQFNPKKESGYSAFE